MIYDARNHKNEKIKIYVRTTPTCFGVFTIIRSVQFGLAKVTFVKTVHVNFNILLKQLFCTSVGNKTLIFTTGVITNISVRTQYTVPHTHTHTLTVALILVGERK